MISRGWDGLKKAVIYLVFKLPQQGWDNLVDWSIGFLLRLFDRDFET